IVEDMPHAVGVVIGVVAEADAHRHQRERDGEAEHDDKDEQSQHQDRDLRIGHRRGSPGLTTSIASLPCAMAESPSFCSTASSSSTSSSGFSHSPVRSARMQRNTWAMPWMTSSTPAATMTLLNW